MPEDGASGGGSYNPELILKSKTSKGTGNYGSTITQDDQAGGGGGGAFGTQARINESVTKIGPIIGVYMPELSMLLRQETL
jgi:hypothetical protein